MMSWTFQLQKISKFNLCPCLERPNKQRGGPKDQSFERIASWYHEFMHRTELCFRALHERVMRLEDQQARQGPSDEQVERVLRKILAERFSEHDGLSVQNSHILKEEDYFVEDRRDRTMLKPVLIDPASLFVDPEAVPSKAYTDTFKLLDRRLIDFPSLDSKRTQIRET